MDRQVAGEVGMMAEDAGSELHVLVIDDEKNIRTTLSMCLEQMDCRVSAVATAEQALVALRGQPFDLAFLDQRLGSANGLELLSQLLAERPNLDVIVITAYAAFDTAVEAIKRGAEDYLPKPFTPAQIRHLVERLGERRKLRQRVISLEEQLAQAVPEANLATGSPGMRAVLELLERAAPSAASVLLHGESGTGKTLLARLVHERSLRSAGPFVVVSCPTLSEELLASELFGHARGAFTGAVREQPGRVEAAHGGTLFLDEVGELGLGLQAKLLRFLQDRQFERLGETRTRTADVRVVVATNRDLAADVQAGRFRLDLMYRLNVVEVGVPPLRERSEDIVPLAEHFLQFFARSLGRAALQLSPAAQKVLAAYSWPGNLRELRNEIERAVVLSRGSLLEPTSFSERVAASSGGRPALGGDFTLEQIEQEHIVRMLARMPTLEAAAQVLGIDASTLWRKRKRFDQS